jgi:hypothetical protein
MVREASIWRVELVRRDTKVQKYAIDSVWDAAGPKDAGHVPVVRFDERETLCGRYSLKSIFVAIDADNTNVGICVKKNTGMPSSAVGTVDDPPCCFWSEPRRHL